MPACQQTGKRHPAEAFVLGIVAEYSAQPELQKMQALQPTAPNCFIVAVRLKLIPILNGTRKHYEISARLKLITDQG
jgi:hypothetical protein